MRKPARSNSRSSVRLVANKLQVQPFAVFAAPGHAFNRIYKRTLLFAVCLLPDPPQLKNKFVHLKMVEDGLTPRVDVTQEMIGEIVPRWKKAAQQTFKVRDLLNRLAVFIFESDAHSHQLAIL